MSDLQRYKKIWKAQEPYQTVQKEELSRMIRRKSSSLVKWIFYISLIEFSVFVIWDIFSSPSLIFPDSELKEMQIFSRIISILSYLIMVFYIVKFYINYKKITVTLSIKDLLHSIIRTRKTVRNYITANISLMALGTLSGAYILLQSDEYKRLLENIHPGIHINTHVIAWLIVIILILGAAGILLLIYYLLYGIIIRRLMNNYKELSRE